MSRTGWWEEVGPGQGYGSVVVHLVSAQPRVQSPILEKTNKQTDADQRTLVVGDG